MTRSRALLAGIVAGALLYATAPAAMAMTATRATHRGAAPTTVVPTGKLPPFRVIVRPVTAAELGKTWRAGCPVGPAQLRLLRLRYVGFDRVAHLGSIVVAASVVAAVTRIFTDLYKQHFPIRQMTPESSFGGSDPASMAADNTSGFNCRLAVATGPPQWSVHAFGEAIDVNPVENPYVFNGSIEPARASAFADRALVRPGMAVLGGVLVRTFNSVGWFWGGRWTTSPDYQHFSETGG
jgi:hypothetical protein